MPFKKKSSGFTHTKKGKFHNQSGGDGRGFVGRRKFIGKVENDEQSKNDDSNEYDAPENRFPQQSSNETNSFVEVLDLDVHSHTLNLLNAVLPVQWRAILTKQGFHALRISNGENIAVQRSIFAPFAGVLKVFVHQKDITDYLSNGLLKDFQMEVSHHNSPNIYMDNILKVINAVRSWEICAGIDEEKFQDMWATDTSGCVDTNIFDETRYVKTFRSNNCSLLIPVQEWRCVECKGVGRRLRERFKCHEKESVHPNTRNTFLDDQQKLHKLKTQQEDLIKARKKIDYLENKVQHLMDTQSIPIDTDLANDLTDILRDTNLTPLQQLFIQQQCKSGTRKKATSMRWHPTMIRFALLIKSTSSAAYTATQNSGVIRLPCERTLFDYSHAIRRSEGVFTEKIENFGTKVKGFTEPHQYYHNLLMDEIHICQKLVYRKSDGLLRGYEHLNDVEKEMKDLVDVINSDKPTERSIATKVLAYMIRGCTSSTREVIAAFPVASLTKQQLFDRTREVIAACEHVGIKIPNIGTAFVCR